MFQATDNLALNVTPSTNSTTYNPPTVDFLLQDPSRPGILNFSVVTNDTVLEGLSTNEVFLSPSEANSSLSNVAEGLADGSENNAVQVSAVTSRTIQHLLMER